MPAGARSSMPCVCSKHVNSSLNSMVPNLQLGTGRMALPSTSQASFLSPHRLDDDHHLVVLRLGDVKGWPCARRCCSPHHPPPTHRSPESWPTLTSLAPCAGPSASAQHLVHRACRQLLTENKGSWANSDICLHVLPGSLSVTLLPVYGDRPLQQNHFTV